MQNPGENIESEAWRSSLLLFRPIYQASLANLTLPAMVSHIFEYSWPVEPVKDSAPTFVNAEMTSSRYIVSYLQDSLTALLG